MLFNKAYVELHSEGTVYPLSEAELSNKLNTGWSVFEGRIDSTIIPSLGNECTIHWIRDSTFTWEGQIINLTKEEVGKEWYYKLLAHGEGRKSKWKIVDPPSGSMTEEDFIDEVMVPLIGELDWTCSGLTNTILPSKSERSKNYVYDILRRFCSGRTINFYCEGGTFHFFKGAESTYPTTLDYLTVKERVEDISKIYNSIDLYNFDQKVFESDDYWTEEESDLNYWRVISSEESGTKDLLTQSEDENEHAIMIRSTIDSIQNIYFECDLGVTLTSDTLVSFNFKYTPIQDAIGMFTANQFKFLVYLMSNSLSPGSLPNNCLVKDLGEVEWKYRHLGFTSYYSEAVLKEVKTEIKGFNTIGTFNGTITHVVFKLDNVPQTHKMQYEDSLIYIYPVSNKPGLIIDKMYFKCFGRCSYANTQSVSQYGVRVYLPDDETYEGSYADGTLKAKGIIDPIAFPETSIRKLELEGTYPIHLGSQYTIDGTGYLVEEVKHIWDGLDWKTELVLSSSEVKVPTRERITKFRDLVSEVRSLRREVNLLDTDVIEAFDELTSILSGRRSSTKLNYLDGTLYADNLLLKAQNIDDLTIERSKIENMNVGTIGIIDRIDEIGTMNVNTIGSIQKIDNIIEANIETIGSLNQINTLGSANIGTIGELGQISHASRIVVDSIGTINTIDHVGIMSIDTITTIQEISDIGIMTVDKITSIGTISTIEFFYAKDSSIDTIGYVGDLTAVNANINTISNVDKAFIVDSSIGALSHVDTAFILDATVTTGTITTLSAHTAGFDLAYFAYCTIADMDITAGSIENVILNKCTITGVTIDAATISNLNIIGVIEGDNIITADNIQNLAISFDHLQKGIQNVLGSTIWEAENLNYGNGGSLVTDSSASGGTLVRSTVSSDAYFVYGPYKTLNPGDYLIHFRLRCQPLPSTINKAVIDINDYTDDVVLTEKTLSYMDFYELQNGSFDWCLVSLLAPSIKAGHTIETRVRNLTTGRTLDVDYIKVEPSGRFLDNSILAPTFKIQTDNIEDFAITGSKIGSLEIDTQHIKNFAIDNSKIGTFTITYDRLVKPPIGWNEVLNGGFEWGDWGLSRTTVDPYEGKWCAEVSEGQTLGPSNRMNLKDQEGTIVFSFARKLQAEDGYYFHLYPEIIWYDSSTGSPVSTLTVDTITVFGSTLDWDIEKYTIGVEHDYGEVRFRTSAYQSIYDKAWIDNVSVTKGSMYTSFIDTTVAKNRWYPEIFNTIEVSDFSVSYPSGTIGAVTLPLTIDFKAKALVFAGVNVRFTTTVPVDTYKISRTYFKLLVDGDTISTKRIYRLFPYPDDEEAVYYTDEITIIDTCTIDPGQHTIKIILDNFLNLTQIALYERYISKVFYNNNFLLLQVYTRPSLKHPLDLLPS